jgi:hypothetical protein
VEQELVRRFQDAVGTEWEVREIHVPSLSIVPRKYLRQPEYADGWLLFTSGVERRRLAPCPCDWREIAPIQLAFLCSQATRVLQREPRRETQGEAMAP